MSEYLLRLYITGRTPRSERAIANLHELCERELAGHYHVEVVDLLECPELAAADQILATPTLIKQLPQPVRRVIGDLADIEKVLVGLDLVSLPGGASGR